MGGERLLLLLGLTMVAAGAAWRIRIARLSQEQMAAALRSADASARSRALRRLATTGLRPYAPLVLRVATASNGLQAAELAWLVAASQWEPADDPALVQLRLWAREHQRLYGTRTPPTLLEGTPGATTAPLLGGSLGSADAAATPSDGLTPMIENVVGRPVMDARFTPLSRASRVWLVRFEPERVTPADG